MSSKHLDILYNSIRPNIVTEVYISNYKFYALWDTGAWYTSISSKVIKIFNLIPIGSTSVGTAGKVLEDVPVFEIEIKLLCEEGIAYCRTKHALKLDIERNYFYLEDENKVEIDVIIGMDIIKKGDFVITQFNNRTFFSFIFPSKNSQVKEK
jgi:hypothetical protein